LNKECFPASLDYLRSAIDFVRTYAEITGFEASHITKIELATEEIFVNIIAYGYGQDKGTIEIECVPHKGLKLTIVIKDEGVPYNPLIHSQLPPNAVSAIENNLPEGGYGVFFVKKVMDEVSYSRVGSSNVLTLIKNI
jgi:serine/threonine-protein kinase RsbW